MFVKRKINFVVFAIATCYTSGTEDIFFLFVNVVGSELLLLQFFFFAQERLESWMLFVTANNVNYPYTLL